MQIQTRKIPAKLQFRSAVSPQTLDEEQRTVDVVWTTGAQVRRYDFWADREFIEELSLDESAVRMDRLNNGAPLLASHWQGLDDVVGVVERAWLDGNEGRATVRFSERDAVKPIIQDVKDGIIRNISVGYSINKMEKQEELRDGLPVYRATDWEPAELSLVSVPADAGAQVRSDQGHGEKREVQVVLPDVNNNRGASLASALDDAISGMETDSNLRADIIASMASAAGIESGTVSQILDGSINCPPVERLQGFADTLEGVSLDDLIAAAENDGCTYETRADGSRSLSSCDIGETGNNKVLSMKEKEEILKAERERVSGIRTFAKKAGVDDTVANDLVERGVELADAKETMLAAWSDRVDAETSRGDTSVTTDQRDKFIDAGVQAIRARAGMEKFDGANEFRGLRLTEIAKACLERAGVSHKGLDEREMVKRAFTTSTSDFPVLLENAMHKTLQAAYAEAADTWSQFCATGSVTDFRAHNRYRTGSFGDIDALGENAEFKNKSIPDGEKATITATTKGNLINISRQTIINDDLGAFIGLSQMLGRAARRTIENDVYALLASNPVMPDGIVLFHANHGNLAAAGAAVTVATVEAARVAMAKQTDISGNEFLDLRPAIWLGGMDKGGDARVINESQYDPDTANKLQKPNKARGLFGNVVDSPRIAGTEWYTFAAPGEAPVIEVAFLNGDSEPFLDSMEGFDVDGMQWKVRLDYGVAAIDFRGAYKNPGV